MKTSPTNQTHNVNTDTKDLQSSLANKNVLIRLEGTIDLQHLFRFDLVGGHYLADETGVVHVTLHV